MANASFSSKSLSFGIAIIACHTELGEYSNVRFILSLSSAFIVNVFSSPLRIIAFLALITRLLFETTLIGWTSPSLNLSDLATVVILTEVMLSGTTKEKSIVCVPLDKTLKSFVILQISFL